MPNLNSVIIETKQSVLRPVILDIVRQIRDLTRIPTSTAILYPDDIGKVYQPGSAISEDPMERTLFPNNDNVFIEVEENYDPSSILTTAVSRPGHPPIFIDNEIGICIKPVYSSNLITINFKYNAKSKSMAMRWRDDIRMRTSASRDVNLHQITYHYIIPKDFMNILKEIHRLRENVAGYEQDFDSYIKDYSTQRLTHVANLSGEIVEPAISETQMRIVGYFDFEGFPDKAENNEDTTGWTTSFSYKFKFDKPIACNMNYPVMVHNQVLKTSYRPIEDSYNLDDHLKSFSLSTHSFNYFEAQLQVDKYSSKDTVINIPEYDEFIPQSVPSGTVSIFNALCQLASDDLKTLLNLNELDTVVIDSDIMDFIKNSEYSFMTKPYKSILHLSLYRSMDLARDDAINLTSDLDIVSIVNLSIRVNHRVRFSIVSDITYLDSAALDRLKKYPKALIKIFCAINGNLCNDQDFLALAKKKYITRDDLFKYITNPALQMQNIQFNTVQVSHVIAISN